MEKIEKYVVFKYEDEFGFHYMEMDKLPGEGSTPMEPVSFKKKINPNCTPGAITRQPFSEDGKSAYALNSKFVPVAGWWPDEGDVLEWQERARVYRALKELKRKGEDLKLEKAIEPIREVYKRSVQAEGVRLLLKWYTSSLSKQFSLKRLKEISICGEN